MKALGLWCVVIYLRFWAHIALKIHKPFIIGIAGSTGKSSTKYLISGILKEHFKTKMLYGNSETGIPLSILNADPKGFSPISWLILLLKAPLGVFALKNFTYMILEMGIDDPYPPKNMDYLLTVLRPDIAISMNISATHTMQFEKVLPKKDLTEEERMDFLLNAIAQEDTKIITKSSAQVAIINADDKYIQNVLRSKDLQLKLLTFGQRLNNNLSYEEYRVHVDQTIFSYEYRNSNQSKKFILTIKNYVLPLAYREVFAAAALACLELGLDLKIIKRDIEKNFSLLPGRGRTLQGINNTLIIDSSYNGYSMETFIELLKEIKQQTRSRVAFLFGDIRELGGLAQVEHEVIAKKLCGVVDSLYCVGELTKKYVIPYVEKQSTKPHEIKHFQTSEEAGKYLQDTIQADTILLVKGSQNTIFLEEAIKYILENKKDERFLCRQEEFWMEIKEKYFHSIE